MSDLDETLARAEQADQQHAMFVAFQAQLKEMQERQNALEAENAELKKNQAKPVFAEGEAVPGGPPVPHHLHLVDGRVIENHDGIATHYSEVMPDGSHKVTRIKAHYPVNEPDPSTIYA